MVDFIIGLLVALLWTILVVAIFGIVILVALFIGSVIFQIWIKLIEPWLDIFFPDN